MKTPDVSAVIDRGQIWAEGEGVVFGPFLVADVELIELSLDEWRRARKDGFGPITLRKGDQTITGVADVKMLDAVHAAYFRPIEAVVSPALTVRIQKETHGYLLLWLHLDGRPGDTWHQSVAEAKSQASFNHPSEPLNWVTRGC